MKWYLTLTILQRINLKELCPTITGVTFTVLVSLYGFKETIELIYKKLVKEGFNI